MVDALHVIGLTLDHLGRIAVTIIIDRQHQLPGLIADGDQYRVTGVTHRVIDAIGQHRGDQLTIEEAQWTQRVHFIGRHDAATGEHVLMAGQLRFDEIVQFVIGRLQRHLVDAELVQPEQLHEHAIEVGELEFDHPLLRRMPVRVGQTLQPLAVGLHQQGQGVLHVVHGGGNHRGEIQCRVVLAHSPNALIFSF
ncbi:hypothetical protein D3C73_1115660 [compost metagenome]